MGCMHSTVAVWGILGYLGVGDWESGGLWKGDSESGECIQREGRCSYFVVK